MRLTDKTAASLTSLAKGWKAVSKGKLVRRDFADLPMGAGMKEMMPTGKTGPVTMPNHPAVPDNLKNKFLAKGPVSSVLNGVLKKQGKKPMRLTGKEQKALNTTMNLHEADEMRHLSKKNHPQTNAGAKFAHHSLANILGKEHNRLVTSGKSSRGGMEALRKLRATSGEKETFDHYALRTGKGETPYKYGEGKRLPKAYKKAMYRKELAESGASPSGF